MGEDYNTRWLKNMRKLFRPFFKKITPSCKVLKAKIVEEYKFLSKDISDYFIYFGPIRDILYTPYFHLAVITALFISLFSQCPNGWSSIALSVLPNILGFSVGGYAIIITFGDDEFRKFLAKTTTNDGKSILLVINGAFMHFIISQTLAIFLAYINQSLAITNFMLNFLMSIPFPYALFFCIAITFEIKTISKWYKKFLDSQEKK